MPVQLFTSLGIMYWMCMLIWGKLLSILCWVFHPKQIVSLSLQILLSYTSAKFCSFLLSDLHYSSKYFPGCFIFYIALTHRKFFSANYTKWLWWTCKIIIDFYRFIYSQLTFILYFLGRAIFKLKISSTKNKTKHIFIEMKYQWWI